jgi:hypothetical protein
MHQPVEGKVLRQRAQERLVKIPSPILPQFDLLDLHFKHIARRRALDGHGPGEDMQSELRRQSLENSGMFRKDGVRTILEDLRTARNRVNRDCVAGAQSEDRLQLSIEKTPMDGLRRGGQVMVRTGHCRDLSA